MATPPHLVVVGPTASGKSQLALHLVNLLGHEGRPAEIVSVDSMAVYRMMDIGTAKPSPAERAAVRHHLLDLVDPDEEYSVARFQRDAQAALADIESRRATAILVGGTGLYLDAVVDGLTLPGRFPDARAALEGLPVEELHQRLVRLDPVAASRIEPTNERRLVRALEVTLGSGRPFSSFGPGLQGARVPSPRFFLAGLRLPRAEIAERIAARYDAQLETGFVDEVRRLRDRFGDSLSRTASQALGYRELLAHLRGECSADEAISVAASRTVAFAKRQERWFRRDQRIRWIDVPIVADPSEYSNNLRNVGSSLLADWRGCSP